MPRPQLRLARWMAALALIGAGPASALNLLELRIEGVDGAMRDNLRARLALARIPPERELSEARLDYLLRQAPREARQALEPFGYYDPKVEFLPERAGEGVRLHVRVDPGEPVRVGKRQVQLVGAGGEDRTLQRLLARFRPRPGEVFDHTRYEQGKDRIDRGLLERGYFAARAEAARVEVTRSEHRADIELRWDSGPRHRFGATEFSGSQLRPDLLQPLLPYREGAPYRHTRLLTLHQELVDLDYFSLVDIQPQPERADGDPAAPRVPIAVTLSPAKRTRYTAGLSYGTDVGAALRLGVDRRWVNARGHKLGVQTEFGQRRSALAATYRIPAFAQLPGWWTAGLNLREEDIAGSTSEIGGLVVGRAGRWGEYRFAAELHLEQERFRRVVEGVRERRSTTLVYPALRLERRDGDHPLYPTRGYAWSVGARLGARALGSDLDFAQVFGHASWVRGFGRQTRLIARAEAGNTEVDDFARLPPSLRFYAGGDRSVRGYGYRELGPRQSDGSNAGGRQLAVASLELERMFNRRWGIAGFVDAGNAFDGGRVDAAVGVGLGLRWRSPVGPVRIDLGRGLDDPERGLRLHIRLGPEG